MSRTRALLKIFHKSVSMLCLCYVKLYQYHTDQARQFLIHRPIYILGGEQIGGSCLRYYAYRMTMAVKMVFVRFGGAKTDLGIWGQLSQAPRRATCLIQTYRGVVT